MRVIKEPAPLISKESVQSGVICGHLVILIGQLTLYGTQVSVELAKMALLKIDIS